MSFEGTDRITARTGTFVFIVGPSGAGKDTIIDAVRVKLVGDSRFSFVRRVVTRPTGQWEAHDSLNVEDFDAQAARGEFAIAWEAHGLKYGIPAATRDKVQSGAIVICNGSRGAIDAARSAFPNFRLVLVTAPREIRMARLTARRREADLRARLDRLESHDFVGQSDLVIDNCGSLNDATQALLQFLRRLVEAEKSARRPLPNSGSSTSSGAISEKPARPS